MAKLFAPSSWVKTGTAPFFLRSGIVADNTVLGDSQPSFIGGPNSSEYINNTITVSSNRGASWTNLVAADPFEMTGGYFTIRNELDLRIFRYRIKFGRSFFVANNTIFAGYLKLDMSLGGSGWTEVATLATWNHQPGTGGSSQASHVVGLAPIFLPGSGPGGADADWILVRLQVTSPLGTPQDFTNWYRSDDFGFSWNFVRTESHFSGNIPGFIRNKGGRILALFGASMSYSDNNGLTWTPVSGGLPPLIKTGAIAHAGNSMSVYMAGGLTTAPASGISCDGGKTWVGTGNSYDGNNAIMTNLALGLVESLVFCSDSVGGTGVNIFYSNNGGETFTVQGLETRWGAPQLPVCFAGFFPDGAPMAIGSNGVVLVSGDRPTGTFGARTLCPFAFAGLKKAGIPPNCGHPILTRCD